MQSRLFLATAFLILGPLASGLWASGTPCGNTNPAGPTPPCPGTNDDDCQQNQAPSNCSGSNPFDVYTGNAIRWNLDLQTWGSVGGDELQFKRMHNTRLGSVGQAWFGQGGNWRHSYQWAVASAGTVNGLPAIKVSQPQGAEYVFLQQTAQPDLWLPAANVSRRVHQDGIHFVMVDAKGRRFYFDRNPNGTFTPLGIQDAASNYTAFTHDSQGRLTRVTEPAGRFIDIQYQTLSIPGRTRQRIAVAQPSSVAGTWRTTTLATPVERRYALFNGAANSFSRVAEVEFYDENNVKLTGTPISSPASSTRPASFAFDGDPATGFEAQSPSFAYVGLDFGSPKKIKRVRVLLDPTGTGGEVHAMDLAPVDLTVISSIATNDGRQVDYQYDTMPDGNPDAPFDYLVLSKAVYGDGTEAQYTYSQIYPMTSPLLETAIEPRAGEDSTRIRYTYNTSGEAPLGLIYRESDLDSGEVLVELGASGATSPVVSFSNGRVQKYNMGTNANLTDYIDGRGFRTRHTYQSGGGFLNKTTDPLNRVTLFTARDALGRPLAIQHPDGTVETWTRNELGQELTHTVSGPALTARTTTTTRDAQYRPVRVDHPDGSYETFAYNAFGQVTAHRQRHGGTVTSTYGPTGLLLARTDPHGQTTTFTYDAQDRPATVTDPRGRVTAYSHNERGLLLQTTHPDGSTVSQAYDAFGNLVSRTDELGHTTSWTYNAWRQVLTVTDPLNRTTTYAYGLPADCGCSTPGARGSKPSKITSASGRVTELFYDKEWNLVSQIDASGTPDEAITLHAYDAVGNRLSTTDPLGRIWTWTYTSRNWKATERTPLNHTTTHTYDGAGNVLTTTRPDGGVTTNTYDAVNRLLTTRNPKLETTTFTYDNGGNLLTLTDAKGNTYAFEYDLLKRKTRMIYPDAGSGAPFEAWAYHDTAAAGSVWFTYTARDGSTMQCTYDNRGRETFCDYSDPQTPDVTYTYDAAGRKTSCSTSVASHAYTYDAANQLLSESTQIQGAPFAASVSYGYNLDGLRSSLTYPEGTVVNYAYTACNQVKEIEAAGPPPLAAYTYDKNGNRITKSLENGTVATYAYDNASRLTQVKHVKSAVTLAQFDYTFNSVGNRIAKNTTGAIPNQNEFYGYDSIDQLTSAAYGSSRTESFAYDPVGNRQTSTDSSSPSSTSYTTNALNQYTAVGGDILLYDGNGNLITKGLGHSYSYDSKNRLTGATVGNGTMTVAYDCQNRAVSRTLNGVTTYLIHDGWNLIAEYSSAGALQAKYVHGPMIDEILAKIDASGTVYYHHDGLGSTVALTNATGDVVESYQYDAFGKVRIFDSTLQPINHSTAGNRFLFTGREYLEAVSLYDYRNRVYSAELGRFLQSDPIRFDAGDVNLYRYVFNNITILKDPTGLDACQFDGAWPVMRSLSGIRKTEQYIDTLSFGPSLGWFGSSTLSVVADLWIVTLEQDWGLYLKIRYWCVKCENGRLTSYVKYEEKTILEWTEKDDYTELRNFRHGRNS